MGEKEDKEKAEKEEAKKKAEESAKKKAEESASSSMIEDAKAEREKYEAATEVRKKENDRTEKMQADNIIAGKGVVQGEPKKLTDEQYADAYSKGEVDPFKEDGYV